MSSNSFQTKNRLTFEQKVDAIQSLRNLGNTISWRYNTRGAAPRLTWYCFADDVEVSDGHIISTTMGDGDTPEAALDDLWNHLTTLTGDKRVVVGSLSKSRHAVRWNGYMWEPFEEPTK